MTLVRVISQLVVCSPIESGDEQLNTPLARYRVGEGGVILDTLRLVLHQIIRPSLAAVRGFHSPRL